MEKLYSNKILNHLTDDNQGESTCKYDLLNYYVKSYNLLNEKLKRGLPVLFVINENEECLFLVNDGPAKHFEFSKHVKALMGLNYFDLKYVKNAQSPMSLLKKGNVKKCALLATAIEGTNKYCYIRVISEYNYKK